MQRNVYIDGRLRNWAEWKVGGSGYRGIDFESGGSDIIRVFIDYTADQDDACLEIDLAIATLPPDLKRVIFAFYTWEGGLSMVVDKLRITRATVHRRLCHADIRLDDYLTQRRARAKEIERRI